MKQEKKQFLEELKKAKGIIGVACGKCGIRSRTTFYNWKLRNKKFKEEAEKIITEEREKMNEFVEGKLFSSIEKNNIAGIIFYLKTRHPQYRLKHLLEMTSKLEVERKLSKKDEELLLKAIKYGAGKTTKKDIKKPSLPKETGKE